MRYAVLRISGAAFDPDRWLDAYGLSAAVVRRTPSGLTLDIGGATAEHLPELVLTWLGERRHAIQALATVGASAELDVGVTVGTSDQYAASVVWNPEHVRALGELGIGLTVSAYPATDAIDSSLASSGTQSLLHVAIVVRDYDEAIAFYCGQLGFTLVEDTSQPAQDKRWVVVAPPGSRGTSLLLARASNPEQERFVGNQAGGRVFLFLETDDFRRDYERMRSEGIRFIRDPKVEPYGTVAVFEDLYGNRWDLIELSDGTSS